MLRVRDPKGRSLPNRTNQATSFPTLLNCRGGDTNPASWSRRDEERTLKTLRRGERALPNRTNQAGPSPAFRSREEVLVDG